MARGHAGVWVARLSVRRERDLGSDDFGERDALYGTCGRVVRGGVGDCEVVVFAFVLWDGVGMR